MNNTLRKHNLFCLVIFFLGSATSGLLAQSTNWLSGTSVFSLTYGTAADSDVVDNATLIVTNGGNLTAGQLNIGPTNRSTLTLLTNASITVKTLLSTNVVCGGVTNSLFNFNGGTLTTSNSNALASIILLASNATYNVKGNWNLNGGTNIFSNVSTNANGSTVNLYVGNGANNVQVNVNPGAIWWHAIPANSSSTNTLALTVGYGNATNNGFTVNGGTLLITNATGNSTPVSIGSSAGSVGNQLVIQNGGQVFTKNSYPLNQYGTVGLSLNGVGNSVVVAGTNAAGVKAAWNLNTDRFSIGSSYAWSNNWARVGDGGVITNTGLFMYSQNGCLFVTNGGQVYASGLSLGRGGVNNTIIVSGTNGIGERALLSFYAGTVIIGGASGSSFQPGTNNTLRVDAGGLMTNVGTLYIGGGTSGFDSNSIGNSLILTNGGQAFNLAVNIGSQPGCNSNSVSIGGGTGTSLWNQRGGNLTIGNNASASNNYAMLFTGGVLTNVATVTLGGVSNNIYFNGGVLAAGALTSSGTGNYIYVQSGGAIIDTGGNNITPNLPLTTDPVLRGGGLTKRGSGTLALQYPNTYTGPTTISAGTLALIGSAAIANSTNIIVAGGAVFDVSGLNAGFTLGGGQTLSNSTVVAAMNCGPNGFSTATGTISLVYDGTNAAFNVGNGTLSLSFNTVFNLNLTSPTLARGSYNIIGGTGLVAGTVPTNVTFTGASISGTPALQIVNGGLYLDVGGTMSGISYGPTTFAYNSSAQSPAITFTGSTGAKTTNYVGILQTTYGPSVNAPTNVGTYYVTNTVAADANYFAAINGTMFTINPVATVGFSSANTGLVLNPAFCGLSYEKQELTKSLFVSTNTALINMFGQIAPAVLRIGGNSVDTTCWGNLSNLTAITTAQVDAFAGFVKALPTNWHVIYGINMAVNNPTNCAAEAAYVANALGSSLLGFEIGNECDWYYGNGIRPSTYNYSQFVPEWQALAAGITNAVPGWAITNGGNGWVLTGPADDYDGGDFAIPFCSSEKGVISMVTSHYYVGAGTSPGSTMALLLSPDTGLPGAVSATVTAATSANLTLGFRCDEAGSFYGGGNTVSAQYGAALWTLDFMFTEALNGCQGVNFHGGGTQSYSSYTPIADNGTFVVMARPEFYGLKLFSLAGQGSVVPATNTVATNFNFTAYGVRRATGGISAVLINKETNYAIQVAIYLGAEVTAAQSLILTGPSLSSTNGYTLSGAPINADGTWTGGFSSPTPATNGQLNLTVPPMSAVLLNPLIAGTYNWQGTVSTTWSTVGNWDSNGIMPTNAITTNRLNVVNGTGSECYYNFPGVSTTNNADGSTCGLVVGNATTSGRLHFTAGIFVSGGGDIVGYGYGTDTLILDGGTFTTPSLTLGYTGSSINNLLLTNGTAAVNSLTSAAGVNLVSLNGGTLIASNVGLTGGITNTLQFNGGILQAGAASTHFIGPAANFAALVSVGGAVINDGGNGIQINAALVADPNSGGGGLTKNGAGTLTLANTNTYSGNTIINGGTLALGTNSSVSAGIPIGSLAHRWSFNNSWTDSVGGSTATGHGNATLGATNVTITGSGSSGVNYVSLGSNLLPTTNGPVTIELWATQNVVENWSRIFDFGSNTANYLMMSWSQGTTITQDQARFDIGGTDNQINSALAPYTLGTQYHIACVIAPSGSGTTLTVYKMDINGNVLALASANEPNSSLANLNEINMWLGRSEYGDADANASYHEVRIWNAALTQAQLIALGQAGADTLPVVTTIGTLANTPLISIANGATLDVSGLTNGLVLGGTQTLSNSAASTATLKGNLNASAAIISVSHTNGTPVFTVTNGTLTLSSTTTFHVNNTGSPLAIGSYLIIATNAGGASSVAGAAPSSVTVNGSGTIGTNSLVISNNTLYLMVASSVSLSRTNITFSVGGSGGGKTLNLSWPADHLGWTLQTNSLGLANSNNWFPYPGSISLTNVVIPIDPKQPEIFYRLMHP